MAEIITTGTWTLDRTRQAAFVEAWAAFATWANTMPGAGTLRLGRDADNPLRFISYGAWQDDETVHAWKSGPEFRERLARVLQHVEDFHPAELAVVATGTAWTGTISGQTKGAAHGHPHR